MLFGVVLCTTLKPNGKFCMGVNEGERLECITVFTEVASQSSGNLHLFCTQLYLHSFLSKKIIENVTVKNCWKESFLSILCFIIYGKGSSEKGLILNFDTEVYLIADCVSCLHACN